MKFDETNCQRCGSICSNHQFSCNPCSNCEIIDRAGIDPVLCDECSIIFIMTYAPDDQYLVSCYEKNKDYGIS